MARDCARSTAPIFPASISMNSSPTRSSSPPSRPTTPPSRWHAESTRCATRSIRIRSRSPSSAFAWPLSEGGDRVDHLLTHVERFFCADGGYRRENLLRAGLQMRDTWCRRRSRWRRSDSLPARTSSTPKARRPGRSPAEKPRRYATALVSISRRCRRDAPSLVQLVGVKARLPSG